LGAELERRLKTGKDAAALFPARNTQEEAEGSAAGFTRQKVPESRPALYSISQIIRQRIELCRNPAAARKKPSTGASGAGRWPTHCRARCEVYLMKRLLLSTIVLTAFAMGSEVYARAQEKGTSQEQQQPEAQQPDAQPASITGCLTKGTNDNEYMIADQKSGEKTSFRASSTLDKYVNQTITLTGKMIVMNGSRIFRRETATPVSNSCGTSQ
jgi:hypothetical protein